MQHFGGVAEGIGYIGAVPARGATALDAAQFLLGNDKTAADREIGAPEQEIAVAVKGGKRHAVGVARQRRPAVEHQIGLGIEAIGRMAFGMHLLFGKDLFDRDIHDIRIDRIRLVAAKAENHRPVGGMADAGIGERAVQARRQPVDARMGGTRPVASRDLVKEHAGGGHRSHRMRTGRPNANLVEIENRQKHSTPSMPRQSACSGASSNG